MEIQMGNILEAACAMAGYELVTGTVPLRWRIMAGTAVNEGLRRIHAEKFPALRRVEFRRYRPIEADLEAAAERYATGQECWCDGKYWRRTATGWEELKMEQVSAFVAFDQRWEATEIDPGGVVVDDFAFEADPKYHPDAAPVKGCGWFADGVLLPAPAPEGVYVKFIPEYPQVSFADWTSGTLYGAGDTVYRPGTHDVWQCVDGIPNAEVAEVAPEDDESGLWRPLRVRGEFAAYLTRLIAVDLLTEDQGKYQTKAAADAELERLIERYHEGNGETRVRTGRFAR